MHRILLKIRDETEQKEKSATEEKPDNYIGQIAAFGSGPSDVPYNEKAARDLARYAKKLREKEKDC